MSTTLTDDLVALVRECFPTSPEAAEKLCRTAFEGHASPIERALARAHVRTLVTAALRVRMHVCDEGLARAPTEPAGVPVADPKESE